MVAPTVAGGDYVSADVLGCSDSDTGTVADGGAE